MPGTTDDRDFGGPYARLHNTMNTRGPVRDKLRAPAAERFTDGLVKALADTDRSAAAASGRTRRCCWCPTDSSAVGMHHMSRIILGIPRFGSMRGGAWPLTTAQRGMVFAAKVLPQPVLTRLTQVAERRAAARQTSEHGSTNDG